ncbi:MAG: 4'-phosphopantetheinyl transferase superfamily protein [Ruminococcaceae bacterium]|nr:4'-phosphopantetheinyl transferase superfamily protein [Oscillospiraceae bacterium]
MIRVYLTRLRNFGENRRDNQRKTADELVKRVCGKVVYRVENGRPMLDDGFVSISHSGEFVACAVSTEAVGLDIEEMRPRKENLWKRAGAEDYTAWCKKEAYVKFLGCGFTVPPSRVSLHETNAWFYTTQTDGYQIVLCAEYEHAVELHREVEENVWETALLHR